MCVGIFAANEPPAGKVSIVRDGGSFAKPLLLVTNPPNIIKASAVQKSLRVHFTASGRVQERSLN